MAKSHQKIVSDVRATEQGNPLNKIRRNSCARAKSQASRQASPRLVRLVNAQSKNPLMSDDLLNSPRMGKSLENGTFTKASYDDAQRLLALDHQHGGLSFQSFTYALNSVGNRTSRQETVAGGPAVIDRYAYDAIDQVTQVRYAEDPSVGASVRRVDYAFDFAGNRTSVTEDADGNGPGSPSVTSYTANAVNQYTAIDHRAAPAFDANGNTITLQAELGGPVWTYQYDAQNRLIGGTSTAGSQFTFAYDPRNRCVVRKINGVITANLYDDWSLISERDASDQQLARYIHGANLDEILLRVTASGSTYSHHDGLGSTTALTDSTGNILERYTYDIYGQPKMFAPDGVAESTSSNGNRFLYTGREWLAELQLNDHRNRYYQPRIGRWLSRDPIGERGGLNIYTYCINGPVNYTDLLGLQLSIPIGVAEAAAGGWTAEEIVATFGVSLAVADAAIKQARCTQLGITKRDAINGAEQLKKCKSYMTCEELKARAEAWQKNSDARWNYDKECHNGGDPGHNIQQQQAQTVADHCKKLMKCKPCN